MTIHSFDNDNALMIMTPQAVSHTEIPKKRRRKKPNLSGWPVVSPRKKRMSRGKYRPEKHANAVLLLEDGAVFWGKGIGYSGTAVGELCFNTAMTGYQEILSDPSYAKQIVNFTTPHIGNVGVNKDDYETQRPFALGAVLAQMATTPSNYRAQDTLHQWMRQHHLVGITGLDTRTLTQKIREEGAPRAVICYQPHSRISVSRLSEKLRKWQGLKGLDLCKKVTTKKPYPWDEKLYQLSHNEGTQPNADKVKAEHRPHIIAIDYGIKYNILRHLASLGLKITIVPADFPAQKIMKYQPDGIFLSNGPGDPAATGSYAVPIIQELLGKDIPIFGICIGHQLLCLAVGGQTEKMYCGHRGGNHPVKNLQNQMVEITSQNHGFHVLSESLPEDVTPTHMSLFDQTLEGIAIKNRPVFSVQYHPEASPGPHDSHYLFKQFYTMVEKQYRKKDKKFTAE